MSKALILAINPGSTSTKFGVYNEETLVFETTLRHTTEELAPFKRMTDQFAFRKGVILEELKNKGIEMSDINVVVGRGGLLRSIESGIYEVNKSMISDLIAAERGEHASNLGALIADDIARSLPSASAYIVDPVVVDELQDVARLSGHPEIERLSIFHALNQKAISRAYAKDTGRNYEDLNLIVAHMGGGISVGAHKKGKVIDVNNAFNGDGPFSPERSGGLPAGQLAELCFSGKYTLDEVKGMITGKGGMVAYLGTNSFRDVCENSLKGDKQALLIRRASSYQIAKEIGAMATVLQGEVDAIILTGGMAYQESNTDDIRRMVEFIAEVVIYPGEDEIKALAFNGLLVLKGEISAKQY